MAHSHDPSLMKAPSGDDAKVSVVDDVSSFDKKSLTTDTAPDLVEPADLERTRFTDWLLRRRKAVDPDTVATVRSVFDDPVLAKHYFPSEKYENRHRFDTGARWTNREEQVHSQFFFCCESGREGVDVDGVYRRSCARSTGASCYGPQSRSPRSIWTATTSRRPTRTTSSATFI
jgi:hypothetical protein